MALIKCRECGKDISDESKVCIHCGCPVKETKNIDLGFLKKEIYFSDILKYIKGNATNIFAVGIPLLLTIIIIACLPGVVGNISSSEEDYIEPETEYVSPVDFEWESYDVTSTTVLYEKTEDETRPYTKYYKLNFPETATYKFYSEGTSKTDDVSFTIIRDYKQGELSEEECGQAFRYALHMDLSYDYYLRVQINSSEEIDKITLDCSKYTVIDDIGTYSTDIEYADQFLFYPKESGYYKIQHETCRFLVNEEYWSNYKGHYAVGLREYEYVQYFDKDSFYTIDFSNSTSFFGTSFTISLSTEGESDFFAAAVNDSKFSYREFNFPRGSIFYYGPTFSSESIKITNYGTESIINCSLDEKNRIAWICLHLSISNHGSGYYYYPYHY